MTIIPKHEPEVIYARARRAPGGGDEKVATTSLKAVECAGVMLSSRYIKAHELERMAVMAKRVPTHLRRFLSDIWCDSKATCTYTVHFRPGTNEMVANVILDALEAAADGHNGIYVQGSPADDRDPYW